MLNFDMIHSLPFNAMKQPSATLAKCILMLGLSNRAIAFHSNLNPRGYDGMRMQKHTMHKQRHICLCSHGKSNVHALKTSSSLFAGSDDNGNENDNVNDKKRRSEMVVSQCNSAADALVLLNEAKALRAEATLLAESLERQKQEELQKQREKLDRLIDALLFHGLNGGEGAGDNNNVQLMQTEEQVAQLFISKRLDYATVSQMFDRIVEVSNRPQSTDNCSPLLSLLLDAADAVDCLEKDENPNKRWNKRAQMDLRRKLFALGYGIRIEDVENERRSPRSITGDKDLY